MTDKSSKNGIMSSSNLPDHIQNACDWSNMRGWYVFPTNPNTKSPCIKDPFGRSTNKREEIIELFGQFPGAGLGVPTGPLNGLTAIDCDVKNGIDGWSNFLALDVDIPITAMVHTPSGGVHLLYETGDLKIPSSVGKIAPSVDERSYGAFAQGPGTITKVGTYKWDHFWSPLAKLAKMPQDLIEVCMSSKQQKHSNQSGKKKLVRQTLLDKVYEGGRNDEMASRIGSLLTELDPITAWNAILYINENCCEPPLSRREIENTFRSILKREMRND